MNDVVLRRPTGSQLLARVLETPDLPARVQALEPAALGRLIDGVGLEDAGEIIALASTEQLLHVFDEDLWTNERPGEDERFDAERFALWLEVMLEAGDELVAARLVELPEELVTLAFHRHVLVLGVDDLREALEEMPEREAERTEKALDDSLYEELDEYQLVAKDSASWDAVLAAILALDRDHHEHLGRILERCRRLTEVEVEESGGLWRALRAAETLAADVAGDREDRRAAAGHVPPADAAAFLALDDDARARDPLTKAYFRELVPAARAVAPPRGRDVPPPLLDVGEGAADGAPRRRRARPSLLATALAELYAAPAAERSEELAYLANVLLAAGSIDGRRLRPIEATETALAVTSFGLELSIAERGDATTTLASTPCDVLFRRGWRRLVVRGSSRADLKLASRVARSTRGARSA